MCGVQRQCCSHCRIAHLERIDASSLKTDAHGQTFSRSLAHHLQGSSLTRTCYETHHHLSKSANHISLHDQQETCVLSQALVNQLLRLALCSYRPARELACPVLEPTCTLYVKLLQP